MPEVETHQRGMLERARGEAILELIVHIELSRFRGRKEVTPHNVSVGRSGGPALAEHSRVIHLDMRSARVLAERRIVREMLFDGN